MAAGNTPTILTQDSEKSILNFCKRAQEFMYNDYSLRSGLENVDKYYQMEGNRGKEHQDAKLANKLGLKNRYQDVVVPMVMPQVEAALGYYVTLFLSGSPIFPVAGPPEYEDAALQLNSLFKDQQKKAKWARQLIMFWRDGLKYNIHGIECDWEQKASYTLDSENRVQEGKLKEVIWAGNVLERMDLYNTFFDPRVAPADVHEVGEFAGYSKVYSRIRMKKFINELFGKVSAVNAVRAFNSTFTGVPTSSGYSGFYVPEINSDSIRASNSKEFNWLDWFSGGTGTSANRGGNISYKNAYLVTKLYGRILPADHGIRVPAENTPQVWKFYIINDSVVIYAERLTNAHNFIPIVFGQPIEDGLNYQTKSFAQNIMPLQDISSTFWNAAIASKRRLTHDRIYYDPQRIRASDINDPSPVARIPVRPSAYGKHPGDAVYSAPYRDDLSASLVNESEMLQRLANLTNGQNPSTQGQFTKGNRTLREYNDVVGHSNTRNQTLVVMTEVQTHTPLKEIILLNTLQYPGVDTVTSPDGKEVVKIDMLKLRTAMVEFSISDGLEPVDKEMNTEELISMMQVVGSTPQLASGYDMPPLFSYIAKLRGADLSPFEKTPEQIQYDQQLAAWQQAAMLAAEKGAAFSTPQPVPPDQAQIEKAKQEAAKRRKMSVTELVQAGPPQQPRIPGQPTAISQS